MNTRARSGDRVKFDLADLISQADSPSQSPPMILRFPGIIRQRIQQISAAFTQAINEFDYGGTYRFIYPIKVNQHAEVIDAVLNRRNELPLGLEAGSKAELLTVVARADNETRILCNGFKDEESIELAFLADLIGKDITIVIEKPRDIELIIKIAQRFKNRPKLGVRTKLGWKGAGRWSSTNGIKSKFGLNTTELLEAVELLREADLLQHLHLLHFHPGSQISDVRLIKTALIEVTRNYARLVELGVNLTTLDVGGGLAIDYTGNQDRSSSSMNYTLQEYANDVVYYIQMVCDQAGIPHPEIYSESGRAAVAHHSVLIVPVFGTSERPREKLEKDEQAELDSTDPDLQPIRELQIALGEVDKQLAGEKLAGERDSISHRILSEAYHDSQQAMDSVLQLFVNGHLTLVQRSIAERLYWRLCYRIRSVLNVLDFVPGDLQQLRDHLADTYFANFSVFQSLPDFWALDQLFPIVPVHRLNERPSRRGVIGDITCDSDGQIDSFLGAEQEQQKSLPLHEFEEGQNYWLGVFLIGAYQEALSDDHNMLGKFNTLIVDAENADQLETRNLAGSDLQEVIEHVNHDFPQLREQFLLACQNCNCDSEMQKHAIEFFESMSKNYTYLSAQ